MYIWPPNPCFGRNLCYNPSLLCLFGSATQETSERAAVDLTCISHKFIFTCQCFSHGSFLTYIIYFWPVLNSLSYVQFLHLLCLFPASRSLFSKLSSIVAGGPSFFTWQSMVLQRDAPHSQVAIWCDILRIMHPKFLLAARLHLFTIQLDTFCFCKYILNVLLLHCRSWDSLQLDCRSATLTRKINLPTNQKGYDTFETTVGKLLARRIQIYPDYVCLDIILNVILNNFQNNA